jgi:NADPH:quinone reductase-like Zn-dependent oxidoreductase
MKRIDLVKVGGFAAGENLVTAEVPAPADLAPGQVVIAIDASAVNPVDWKQAMMGFMMPPGQFPVALGCDVAGVVTATAPDATEWLGMSFFLCI